MDISKYSVLLRSHIHKDYEKTFRPAGGALKYPFFTPGSEQYNDVLWDWDSWLSNIALRQILLETSTTETRARAQEHERGCILNFLSCAGASTGYLPISLGRGEFTWPQDIRSINMHKPCLAQHAAFLIREDAGDAEWLREHFKALCAFINFYRNHHRHEQTGLYLWQNDEAIGVDNDPCTYGRPPRSSGSIYLNCLMYKELLATAYIAKQLGLLEVSAQYSADANLLADAIREHCWDEWTGFYYSVDFNVGRQELHNLWGSNWGLHAGYPCDWHCLIQRIGVWSGFLALWAGIASPEQAARMAKEHYRNPKTFGAPYGVRTLSKLEKMYNVRPMGNPSSWLGPIWGVSNYLTWSGFVRYGLEEEAKDIAEKTILLFGRDVERFDAMHEYYEPDSGEPVLNRGFQNWNFLVLNMIAWLEKKPVVSTY